MVYIRSVRFRCSFSRGGLVCMRFSFQMLVWLVLWFTMWYSAWWVYVRSFLVWACSATLCMPVPSRWCVYIADENASLRLRWQKLEAACATLCSNHPLFCDNETIEFCLTTNLLSFAQTCVYTYIDRYKGYTRELRTLLRLEREILWSPKFH